MLFVTSNPGKVREAKEIIDDDVEQANYDYMEIQSDSLEEIASHGAYESYLEMGEPCFVDDSGLFIDTFDGFPGPYSSYVHGTLTNKGVLRLMEDVENRNAEFRCVVAYCESSDDEPEIFRGAVQGEITTEERGSGGFGYDPIFEYQGETFAEMSQGEKNEVSHRKRAFRKFSEWYQHR